MCGRFHIEEGMDWRSVLSALGVAAVQPPMAAKRAGEICPTEMAAVVALSRQGRPSVFPMRWGYAAGQRLVINARSETAAARPLFADGMARRRCVIPASFYLEWERSGRTKTKYAVHRKDGAALYLSGLYRHVGDHVEFVVLTRPPAESIAALHDRMPVLLEAERAAEWVSPQADTGRVLRSALLSVMAAPTADAAPRQLGMEL